MGFCAQIQAMGRSDYSVDRCPYSGTEWLGISSLTGKSFQCCPQARKVGPRNRILSFDLTVPCILRVFWPLSESWWMKVSSSQQRCLRRSRLRFTLSVLERSRNKHKCGGWCLISGDDGGADWRPPRQPRLRHAYWSTLAPYNWDSHRTFVLRFGHGHPGYWS
jgi:hypothetical protein